MKKIKTFSITTYDPLSIRKYKSNQRLKSDKLKKMSSLLNSAVFPGNQGGPLEHIIAAKAVAFKEALSDDFLHYMVQVKKNAQTLASALIDKGFNIISDGTDNHMMLIDLRNKGITGKDAEELLGKIDITVNKNMVPFDNQSPFITSGIRIGTAAVTTRGLKEDQMNLISQYISDAITNKDDESKLKFIKEQINLMMSTYSLFQL